MEQGLFRLLLFVFLYIFPITNLLCDYFVCNLKSAAAGIDFCVPCGPATEFPLQPQTYFCRV